MSILQMLLGSGAIIELFFKFLVTKGFFSGGSNGQALQQPITERTTYSTETTVALSSAANITGSSSIVDRIVGLSNKNAGYFMAGAGVCANKIPYSTETTVGIASLAVGQRRTPGGTGNSFNGYVAGGDNGSSVYNSLEKMPYSTEVSALVAGQTLSQARTNMSGAGNADKGFVGCGTDAGLNNGYGNSDKITYASDTMTAASSAGLTAKGFTGSAGDETKGFFAGGKLSSGAGALYYNNIEKITYSTEASSSLGIVLSVTRGGLAATGDITKGFFSGGEALVTGSTVNYTTTDKITYTTETIAAVSGANLTYVRSFLGAA